METVSDEKHSITVILLLKIDENLLFSVNHTQNQWLLILHCSYVTCKSLINTYLDFKNLYLTRNLYKLDKFLQEKWLSFSNFQTLSDKNYWDLSLWIQQLTFLEFLTLKVPTNTTRGKHSHSILPYHHAATMCRNFSSK